MPTIMQAMSPTHERNHAAPSRLQGAPAGYKELNAFLPDRTQRRLALGVTENTIIAWDAGRAQRVRREHTEKVATVLRACERIRPFFSSASGVGTFLFTPQLVLDNYEPYGLLRLRGQLGAEMLAQLVEDGAKRASVLREQLVIQAVLDDDSAWNAIRAGLSDSARKRLEESEAEATALRERRDSRDMLA
jgi:hypothetical protein